MEPLDIEEVQLKEQSNDGKVFGIIGFGAYIVAALTAIYSIVWGSYKSYHSIYGTSGAPDAVSLSAAIRVVTYASFLILLFGLIGLIFQRLAFNKGYKPVLLWRVLLSAGFIILFSGIFPPKIFTLFLGGATLFHVFSKKQFYFQYEYDIE